MMEETLIPVGEVRKTFGIKGEVRVRTYSGEGKCLSPNVYIYLEKEDGVYHKLKIARSRPFKNFFIVKFEGIESPEKAEEFIGCRVFLERSSFPELEEDEYYWVDLLGSSVYSLDGQLIGLLENIIETGGVDVFEIKGDKELLVPFSKKFVKSIDIREKKIIIDAEPFL